MKTFLKSFALLMVIMMITSLSNAINAQDEEKTGPSFTAGADIYSNYVWRGSKLGTGPAIQPSVKFTAGGFTAGVWGSFDAAGYSEVDPYISYLFTNGLSIGLTDYYYPFHTDSTGTIVGSDFFDTDKATSFHAFEVNVGFTKGGLSLSANYILNEAAGALSSGGDKYFQIGYAFKKFNISMGAGDGWHTSDTEFNVCHLGIGTSKEIKLSETFSIPVSGQVILNPDKKQLFLVVGFSL